MAVNLSPPLLVGVGVNYLLATVANADQPGKPDPTFINYYTMPGTPPGRWLGAGAEAAGLPVGDQITPLEAKWLFQHLEHPITRMPLTGRNTQLKNEPDKLSARTVAGFDMTFTLPKSVSLVFAAAPPSIQRQILACHYSAIEETLRWAEANVFQTRSGQHGVVASAIKGVIAGRWDHWDSREGDPHLHSHLVISNRVQRASDGVWLSLDSSAYYRSGVAVSELHTNLVLDALHRRLGLEYHIIDRPGKSSRAVVADVRGVPTDQIDRFSSRAVAIRERIDQLRAKWQATHKGTPDAKLVAKWKEQAWRETRPAKDATHRTLAELCHRWAKEIKQFGYRPKTILKAALGHPPNVVDAGTVLADKQLAAQLAEVLLAHSAANLKPRDRKTEAARLAANPDQVLEMAAGPTLAGVANWRTTWSELQLRASAERLTRMVRFNSPQARQQLVDEITARAASRCRRVRWDRYVLPDDASGDLRVALRGRAGFDQQHQPTYTTHLIWDAETNLMRLFTTTGDNTVPYLTVEAATQAVEESVRAYQAAHGFALASDQRRAVEQVLASQTRLTAIVGPAGTGKTTSMKVLRDTWEHVYGGGRVVALAPSAAAAQVLGTQLDVAATTVAKWLWETDPLQQAKRRQRIDQLWQAPGTDQVMTSLTKLLLEDRFYQTKPFDLVIVDEAAMTGTISLARLADQVEQAGAKMLLVGDPSQLDAVEAGGILGWADREGHATELTSLWRFEEPWMASASLALRRGRHIGIDQYAAHGMIHEGSSDDMREAAYAKALNDFKTGVPAVLIAASNEEVTDLSERASLDLRAAGLVDSTASIPVRAGLDAGLGERIVARKNDRRVQDQYGNPINNGTFMRIIEAPRQGPVIAVREDNHATIELDPTWIQQNCELGYAVTVHRAQGITVDHSYFLLGAHARTTRELFYVAMTRGRKTNQVFTALMSEEEAHHLGVRSDDIPTAEQRLTQVLRTEGAEKTAHETADQLTHEGMALQRLIPEHDYLASLVYAERCKQDLKRANPTLADGIDQYPAWPSLVATWTKARMIAPTDAWMRVSKPVIEDNNIGDVAAILHSRLTSITDDAVIDPTDQRWIGGLVPAIRTTDPVIGALAQQNETMIEQRIRQLAAVTHPWETDMAPRPDNNTPAVSMWDAARLQAAIYRDQWGVDSIDALGPAPVGSERQHRQWQRAKDNLAAHDWVPQPADDLIEAWDELGAAPPTDPPPEEPPPEPELEPGLLPPAVWSDPTSGAGL